MSILHAISGCVNSARKADVVFLHGLGGDAFDTWRHRKDPAASWPHWLGEEFSQIGVWSLGYAASPTKFSRFFSYFTKKRDAGYSMSLPDRATQVLDSLVLQDLGQRPLLFIGHSLGGLLIKQILRTSSDSFDVRKKRVAANTHAVLFLATPHAGAPLATLADAFRTVFGATVSIEDLKEHDSHLANLHNWYRNHSLPLGIHTATYYEKRGVNGVVAIVNPTSAHPAVGDDPIPLDEDHISIAKPRIRNAQVCLAAQHLVRNHLLAARAPRFPSPPISIAPSQADNPLQAPQKVVIQVDAQPFSGSRKLPIPHELPPAAEQFFGRQEQLKQLIERLQARKNTAVVGDAGLGKTALAAEAVRAVVGETPESLALSPYPDGVLFLDFYLFKGMADIAWNNMADKLSGSRLDDNLNPAQRAASACQGRSILVIIEGGEEADGKEGRALMVEWLKVLSPQSRWLLLTRLSTQATASESIGLKKALDPHEAAELFDSLTGNRLSPDVRAQVLDLLDGHPLGLTWAGNHVGADDEDPERLIQDWHSQGLLKLSHPKNAQLSLEWLYNRSVRKIDANAKLALSAAGLLAHAPVPFGAFQAALGDSAFNKEDLVYGSLRTLVQRGLLRRSSERECWQFTHVLGYFFSRKASGPDSGMRIRLGSWLRRHVLETMEKVDEERVNRLWRVLRHAGALLQKDQNQELWQPLVEFLRYDVIEKIDDLGRLTLVHEVLQSVSDWMASFPDQVLHELYWLREKSGLLNLQGHFHRKQGRLEEAISFFQEGLAISRQLMEADPSNTTWQRDLSICLENVGGVFQEKGNLEEALSHYQEVLAIARHLTKANPSNSTLQRDLSISLNKLGSVFQEKGNLEEALSHYQEDLAITRRLAQSDPSNANWQRDLSVSLNKLGGVFQEQGRLEEALSHHQEFLAITRRLAKADPSNATWQRDMSVGLNRLGGVFQEKGNLEEALSFYQESLSVRQQLAEADTSNATWQRDLSLSLEKMGTVLQEQGRLEEARVHYQECLNVRQLLAKSDISNAIWQRDLSISLNKLGSLFLEKGNPEEALPLYQEDLIITRRLAEVDPSNATWQRDLSVSLENVGTVLQGQGRLEDALSHYQESLSLRKLLAKADLSNATWQRDLNIILEKVGTVFQGQGRLEDALSHYQESLSLRKLLAKADPSNVTWQRDLGIGLIKVGSVFQEKGNLEEAISHYQEDLTLTQRIAEADPSNTTLQRDLSISLNKVGGAFQAQGRLEEALSHFQSSLNVIRQLAEADPSNANWQRDYSYVLKMVAHVYESSEKVELALTYAEKSLGIDEQLVAINPDNPTWVRDLALSRSLVNLLKGEEPEPLQKEATP